MEMAHANFKGNCWRLRWTPDGPLMIHFSIFMTCVTPQRNLTLGSPVGMERNKGSQHWHSLRTPFFCLNQTLIHRQLIACPEMRFGTYLSRRIKSRYFNSWDTEKNTFCRKQNIILWEKQTKTYQNLLQQNKQEIQMSIHIYTQNTEHKRPADCYSWCGTWHHSLWELQVWRTSLLSLKLLPSCKQN